MITRYSEDVEVDVLNSLLGIDKGESNDFDKPKKKKSGGEFNNWLTEKGRVMLNWGGGGLC